MMTKQEHITYWVETADKNWKAVSHLFKAKCYVESLFWAHLVLEKLLKAHWVKDNTENTPPKTHHLIKLAAQTKLVFTDDELLFLAKMNDVQIEGRYPDYIKNVYKIYKLKQTTLLLNEVDKIRKCLLNNLQ
jgi:HEPN domain-containing protein